MRKVEDGDFKNLPRVSQQEGGGAGTQIQISGCASHSIPRCLPPQPRSPCLLCALGSWPLRPQPPGCLLLWPSRANWRHKRRWARRREGGVYLQHPHAPTPCHISGRSHSPHGAGQPLSQYYRLPYGSRYILVPLSPQARGGDSSQGLLAGNFVLCWLSGLPAPCDGPLLNSSPLHPGTRQLSSAGVFNSSFLLFARKDVKGFPLYRKKKSFRPHNKKLLRNAAPSPW